MSNFRCFCNVDVNPRYIEKWLNGLIYKMDLQFWAFWALWVVRAVRESSFNFTKVILLLRVVFSSNEIKN